MEDTRHPPLPVIEHYKIVRSQIEHEDNLVSQRLSWLLASQSFLFTAYAITLNGPVQLHMQAFERQERLLMLLLPIVGMCSAALIWIGVLAGIRAMSDLRKKFRATARGDLPAGLPPIQTFGRTLAAGMAGPMLVPLLFIVIWFVLVVRA